MACQDWAATKAAYRFFDNPRIDSGLILAGHVAATAARFAAVPGTVLVLHDTTESVSPATPPTESATCRTSRGGTPPGPSERPTAGQHGRLAWLSRLTDLCWGFELKDPVVGN